MFGTLGGMNSKTPGYQRHLTEIISHVMWLYHRFCLRVREVKKLLGERWFIASYETVRPWCQKFCPAMQASSKNDKIVRVILGNSITCIVIQGQQHYLRRAVDPDGDRIDMLVQLRRIHMQAVNYRLLRSQVFRVWKEWVCA